MPKFNQFEKLVIHEFEDDVFPHVPHTHTYYEIIYIKKGNGVHHLNHNLLPYKSGDLFVISPEDEHYFEIKKRTRFVYIKFTDNYFDSNKNLFCDDLLLNTPEDFMRNKLLKETLLKLDDPCKTILKNTIENITAYNCKADVSSSPIVFYQILSIFGLIKETIYHPKLVQIKVIADHFNIAQTYFSAYFKRTFAISYRDYIHNLRTTLIEKRIHNNQLPIKQIAHEFGFTDESHLSNYFKKRKNMKPTDYKKL
jgi:AraC-like DNA-binding protein